MKSHEQLLTELRTLNVSLGRVPKQKDCGAHNGTSSYNVYIREFGSFNEAVRLAGMEPRHASRLGEKKFTEQQLLDSIRNFVARNGHVPSERDCGGDSGIVDHGTLTNHFGSYREAIRKAGFEPNRAQIYGETKHSRAELLRALEHLTITLGYIPTHWELRARGKSLGTPTPDKYLREFGSILNALRATGIRFSPIRYRLRSSLTYGYALLGHISRLLREHIKT